MFDADAFMNATTAEANDTKIAPCPQGEYFATIEKVEPTSGTTEKGTWAALNVTVGIEDPEVKAATGMDKKLVRGTVFLDLNDSGTGLDMGKGKNVRLGKLRQAANLNAAGQAFAPSMLVGRQVKVKVTHRQDKNDSEVVYDDIGAWLPA